ALLALLLEQLLDGPEPRRRPLLASRTLLLDVDVLDLVLDRLLIAAGGGEGGLADVVNLAFLPHLQVRQLRVDGATDVAGQRPARRRPDEQTLAGPVAQREPDEDRLVMDLLVAFLDLHLAEADAAARAPRHGVEAAVDQAALVALLEEGPDRVVVLLRHREVR